jgi:hypothetical protein
MASIHNGESWYLPQQPLISLLLLANAAMLKNGHLRAHVPINGLQNHLNGHELIFEIPWRERKGRREAKSRQGGQGWCLVSMESNFALARALLF